MQLSGRVSGSSDVMAEIATLETENDGGSVGCMCHEASLKKS